MNPTRISRVPSLPAKRCDMIISRVHQDAVISQKSVIQLACAVLETLELPSNKHWDQLASIEKVRCLYY